MADTWILVAGRARARLFSPAEGAPGLVEIEDFVNAEARIPGHELRHAPPPRVHDRFGEGRHVIEAHTPPKKKVSAQFAAMLASFLADAHAGQRYRNLILIAPPAFLGMLHAALDAHLRRAVVWWVAKNLTRSSIKEIRAEIPRRLLARGPLSPPPMASAPRADRPRPESPP
jgi:protein required for attachment to host cells